MICMFILHLVVKNTKIKIHKTVKFNGIIKDKILNDFIIFTYRKSNSTNTFYRCVLNYLNHDGIKKNVWNFAKLSK